MRSDLNFVLCPSYHGATLLALLLNNHSKISCLGDTIPTKKFEQVCSCGKKVSVCEFWQSIRSSLNTDQYYTSINMIPSRPQLITNRKINRKIVRLMIEINSRFSINLWHLTRNASNKFADMQLQFYETVKEMHGTDVIIDGQKELRKLKILNGILKGKANVKVLHLVRDPRGFLNSSKKYIKSATVKKVSEEWLKMHTDIRNSCDRPGIDYLLVKYENLCENPAECMRTIFNFYGYEYENVITAPKYLKKHHLMGNKMVFEFDGTVKLDLSWKERLNPMEANDVLKLTQPLSRTMGYIN